MAISAMMAVHILRIIVLFTYCTEPPGCVSAGLKGALTTVKQHVVSLVLADYKVSRGIVGPVSIDMMQSGFGRKGLAQYFLCDDDML